MTGEPDGPVTRPLRLAFRPPLVPGSLFGHLAVTAVPGVEEWRSGAYRRTLRLRHGPGVVSLLPQPDHGHIAGELTLTDRRDEAEGVAACRRMLDLDADPAAVTAVLGADPVLGPLVASAPGRRIPGTPDGAEFAVRVVLGQQVSVAAARTHAGRLAAAHGEPVADPAGGLTRLFPTPAALAAIDPATLPFPATRQRTFAALTGALAAGTVDLSPGADPERATALLAGLPGIGPWSVAMIAMRALGDPDAFVPGDLGIRSAARALGLPAAPGALTRRAQPWRPWRSYSVQYLWAALDHAINRLPDG
jgi:AraC family transcriptional regulator of adaptative response / DNA-3-methyladenine glycosylase II